MRYLQSHFLNSLATKDNRLIPITNFNIKERLLLIEEADLSQLDLVASFNLIILTEKPRPFSDYYKHHKVVRTVYKYEKVRVLLSKIFDQSHAVIFYTSTIFSPDIENDIMDIAKGINSDYINSVIPDFSDETSILDLIKVGETDYKNGFIKNRYCFINCINDVIDPPLELIRKIVEIQSKTGIVSIVGGQISSPTDLYYFDMADLIVIITNADLLPEVLKLKKRYNKVLPIVNGFNKEFLDYSNKRMLLNIIPRIQEEIYEIQQYPRVQTKDIGG